MRLITWNCHTCLYRKLHRVLDFDPDIVVFQECEQDLPVPQGYKYLWRGNNRRKGLGVLCRGDEVTVDPIAREEWTYFVPVTVNPQRLRIVASWAYNHRASKFGPNYVGNPLAVLPHLSTWLSKGRSIFIGDLNNSVIWDREGGPVNFSEIDANLGSLGLASAYHSFTGEVLGHESTNTFFHTKSAQRPFHIDYCFVHSSLSVGNVAIPPFEDWRSDSDHVPVVVDLNDA